MGRRRAQKRPELDGKWGWLAVAAAVRYAPANPRRPGAGPQRRATHSTQRGLLDAECGPAARRRETIVLALRHADAESTTRARLHPVTPSQRRFSISLHDLHLLLAQTRTDGQGRRPPARR